MSKRNTHKKSRAGCSSCKTRHVKCDESGPPCANCRVRDLECDFEAPTVNDASTSNPGAHHVPVATVGSKRFELELFHQWTSETYKGFVFRDGDDTMWQKTIPLDAFQHSHLLHSIYAISSLHLSSIRPSSTAPAYRQAALEYQNLAIAAFRSEERQVTPDSSQNLFVFSAIHVAMALIVSEYQQTPEGSVLGSLKTVLDLLQGSVSIYMASQRLPGTDPDGDVMFRRLSLYRQNLDVGVRAAFERLRSLRDEDYCVRSRTTAGATAVYLYESMKDAIDKLELHFEIRGDDGQVVPFSWLSQLQLGFVDAIVNQDSLALVVLAHWAILLDSLGSTRWWARSSGKILVAEVASIVLAERPEWLPALSWVHVQVGLPPPIR